ncbi:diguanylate cyclase [Marinobacter halodurans]|uniref:diguanylate cyclase n=1 Tax=Marinobacter halodurans TaxID=2528979 RepID=A0ABY1ZKM2_9GAMM|nr:diguanylate cyclase [Marinobacter halodurans]TBW51262.1 diguanylate cyclase [Marinobacter halodurans]
MYASIKKLWLRGTLGRPPRLARQIALTNQIALFGAVATLPYQLFYLFYDMALYWPVFSLNMLFMAGYLAALGFNWGQRHTYSRNLVLINACTQILVVTYFIGAAAGVHLFYYAIGSVLSLIFIRYRAGMLALLLGVLVVLFLVCQFAFAEAATPVPEPLVHWMFAVSVVGAMTLSGSFSYLFRKEIDHAEDQLIQSNRDLEKLSSTDKLTGLANRRSLDRFLNREWSRSHQDQLPTSILMCDVDCFKSYNDHYGHQAGDECLQAIAQALTDVVRRPTDLVTRYGGEEFAIVLPMTPETDAGVIAERLRARVESLAIPHARSEVAPVVTISVGLSTLAPAGEQPMEQVLAQADSALYRAKREGRNQVRQYRDGD